MLVLIYRVGSLILSLYFRVEGIDKDVRLGFVSKIVMRRDYFGSYRC